MTQTPFRDALKRALATELHMQGGNDVFEADCSMLGRALGDKERAEAPAKLAKRARKTSAPGAVVGAKGGSDAH